MWGMTELSPLGSLGVPTRQQAAEGLSLDELVHLKTAQGRPNVLCDMRLVDDSGGELPRDGTAEGELQVRGSIVVQQYHGADQPTVGQQRWFATGDVASIDSSGTMRITDRSKDVVMSGGEWNSSIALENTAASHPKVLDAVVIALPDEEPAVMRRDCFGGFACTALCRSLTGSCWVAGNSCIGLVGLQRVWVLFAAIILNPAWQWLMRVR